MKIDLLTVYFNIMIYDRFYSQKDGYQKIEFISKNPDLNKLIFLPRPTSGCIHFGIPNLKSLFIKFATHQNVSLNDVKYDVCISNSFLFIYEIPGPQKSGQLVTDDNDNI